MSTNETETETRVREIVATLLYSQGIHGTRIRYAAYCLRKQAARNVFRRNTRTATIPASEKTPDIFDFVVPIPFSGFESVREPRESDFRKNAENKNNVHRQQNNTVIRAPPQVMNFVVYGLKSDD